MSKIQKSTALYPHPFSKAYWRDAAAEMKSTKTLVIAALMIALRVACKGLSVPIAPSLDLFNVASFINALSAMIIGPVVAIPAAIISDFLGVMIWDGLGTYFLPFVLQEIGSSLIWALLLYRSKVTPWRVILGRFAICFLINIALGTPLLVLYQNYAFGASSLVLTWPRIFKNTFMFPIEAFVMTLFLSVMLPVTNKMGLTYFHATDRSTLKFTKVQIISLVLLFVLGIGCVGGYLSYHYETTSLSASYTTDERVEKNQQMLDYLQESGSAYDKDHTITIVDSAKKEFLGKEVTYTVSVYTYETLSEDELAKCWALSKSGPKKEPYSTLLQKAETVVIVVNEKTGDFSVNLPE